MSLPDFSRRRDEFRALHASACFVLPNPWDGRSAIRMARAGFKALASTSAGAAWALGKEDGDLSVEQVLEHLRFLCTVTNLPINADFEAGFSDTLEGLALNVERCIGTGVSGLSIEDRDGTALYSKSAASERLRAAREAIDRSGTDVVLVGRCEAYLMATLEIDEVITRLNAYAEAGADCLYAPGLGSLEDIRRVVASVSKPVNANLTGTGLSVKDLASVGVRRVSVGAALAKATYDSADAYIEQLRVHGVLPKSY